MQGLLNMVDGVEQTSLNPEFFPAWFLLNMALHYDGEAQYFFNQRVWGVFLDFHAHIGAVKSISLHCCLETQNEWQSHHTHRIICLPWRFTFGVVSRDHLCQSSAFGIEHCYKRPIFHPLVMIFLRNRSFLCFERRLVACGILIVGICG